METPPAQWLPRQHGKLPRLSHNQVQQSRWRSYLRQSSKLKRTAVEADLVENGGQRAGAPPLEVVVTPATGAAVSTTTSAILFPALRVVLEDHVGGSRWLGSVRELQSVCFEACKECRKVMPVRLRVSEGTPDHLWKQGTTAERAMAAAKVMAVAELEPDGSSGGGGGCGSSSGGGNESYGSGSSDSDCYGSGSSGDGGCYEFDLDGAPGSEVSSEDAAANDVDGSECSWSLPSLWGREEAAIQDRREAIPSPCSAPGRHVPPLSIMGMVWERSTLARISFGRPELPEMAFGAAVVEPLHGTASTSTLKRITLGSKNWSRPPTTAMLDAEGEIDWPPSLEEMTFGEHFNAPINQVAWPDSLQQLSFGRSFNQPIAGVSFPPSLQQLKFGLAFDQPIDGVGWPPRLRRLTFGARFNRHLVSLPSTLEQLTFGYFFDNRSVSGAVWPSTLMVLTFGHDFDTDIIGVTFPASLQRLTFGFCFNRPINCDGVGVAFPLSLQQLSFGACFNQPVDDVVWPASLRRLAFGFAFRQSVDRWAWPVGLTHLSVSRWCSLSRIDAPTGVQLELT
ncbi:unnamed protein product [Ectocarpus fasciculatus]